MYIYQCDNWPNFTWDKKIINDLLIELRFQQGRLIGGMESIGFQIREETVLKTLTSDVVKSSEIEGEILDQSLVRSSVARKLGMDIAANKVDRNVDGVVEMMLDATQNYDQKLTKKRLLKWHASLFPTGRSGTQKIIVGAWRKGSVEVISGRAGKEKIHFKGPPAEDVNHQMLVFLNWINHEKKADLVLKAAIAHLWFVTIHPFDDGNGRIGRAIADLLLARSEKSASRFYSLSSQIQLERKHYYTILEKTQKGNLDITHWIEWFLACLSKALQNSTLTLHTILQKGRFWEKLSKINLNERQKKMINMMIDGFKGNLTTTKWAKITKSSQDTAYRDILELINLNILIKNPQGGRSTSYSLRHHVENK